MQTLNFPVKVSTSLIQCDFSEKKTFCIWQAVKPSCYSSLRFRLNIPFVSVHFRITDNAPLRWISTRLTVSHAVKCITHSCTWSLKSISQEPKKQHLSAISPSAAEQVPAVKESNVKSNHQTARYSFRCLIDSSSAWVTRLSKRPFGGKHMFVRVHCSPEFASTYPWISESLEERSTWAHHANNAWLDATSTSKKAWYDDVMHKNNTE